MKKIFFIAISMMATVMPSFAQVSTEHFHLLKGEELKACLDDPVSKAQYIKSLNAIAAEDEECKRWDVQITDICLEPNQGQSSSQGGVAGNGPHKASIFDAAEKFGTYHRTKRITYNTVDGNNHVIRASAVIYLDDVYGDFDFGLLSCHPTVTSLSECPTGPNAPEHAISAMGDENCMVVCPDYCGYGTTADRQHPYLIQDVTARNCIDAYLSAISILKSIGREFESDFYTLFIGYSQGGSVAMACQKMIDLGQVYSQEQTNKINLRRTFCGDGPYSPPITISQYLWWANKGEQLAYPCVLPLILMAAIDAYQDDCMRTVKYEDFFTKEFLATGVTDLVKNKLMVTSDINEVIWSHGVKNLDQMLSDKILKRVTYTDAGGTTRDSLAFNTETNEYKCLMRALSKNDVTQGWTPQHNMTIFHYTDDKVVPFANSNIVKDRVESGAWPADKITFKDAKDAFDEHTIDKIIYTFQLNDAMKIWDHVTVGTLFYCWFMFGYPEDHRGE